MTVYVKKGDRATIIKSVDGINVGKIVDVVSYQGEHSTLGPIWHIRTAGSPLVTEYGGVGLTCDCPDEWLRPLVDDPALAQEVAESLKLPVAA